MNQSSDEFFPANYEPSLDGVGVISYAVALFLRPLLLLAGGFGLLLSLVHVADAFAQAPTTERAKLGGELTPVGAIVAANEDQSIPRWTRKDAEEQQGPLSGDFPTDYRIDREAPVFTITAADIAFHGDRLTEGHRQLLARYPDYKMLVYPTHRTSVYPLFVDSATTSNAVRCNLVSTNTPANCWSGFPFPVPRSGAEAMWNHKLRWRGVEVERHNNQFIVQANGAVMHNRILEQVRYQYAPSLTSVNSARPYEIVSIFARTLSPARIAENSLLVREKTGANGREAWYYSSSLRRVYRTPGLQYDQPYPDTDGHQHFDQVDMFNGELDRFDWTIVGRKELYLPYNSNRLAGRNVKYADLIRSHHLNQDLPRYELHRYWVVDATLKPGAHHLYKLRRFYLDEDSWNIEAVDNYDASGSLVSFQEGHLVHFANSQVTTTAPQVIYDLAAGSYFVAQAFNEDAPPNFDARFPSHHFTPESMTRVATR